MSTYTDAVETNLTGLKAVSFGPCYGQDCCEDYDEHIGNEASFSWSSCGICGTSLGGNRYVWHWIDEDNELMHEDNGCTDCLVYISNGDEPE